LLARSGRSAEWEDYSAELLVWNPTSSRLFLSRKRAPILNDAQREYRTGWDATFSAPKSVSLTALVGGDDRVREAHRESVRAALSELERYTEARIGSK
jgi:TrwC relaxase